MNDDEEIDQDRRKAERGGRLSLSRIDREQAASPHLRSIGRQVHAQPKHRRQRRRKGDAEGRQNEKEIEELHDRGGAPQHLDIAWSSQLKYLASPPARCVSLAVIIS